VPPFCTCRWHDIAPGVLLVSGPDHWTKAHVERGVGHYLHNTDTAIMVAMKTVNATGMRQGVALEVATPPTRVNAGTHAGRNAAVLRCLVTSRPCESLPLHVVRDIKPVVLCVDQLGQ
jgi:hypothetical protein